MNEPALGVEGESQHEREVAEAVLGYLREHPKAMDTLEGIAYFWVMRQRVAAEVTILSRVLERLTASGRLEKIGSGENALYRLRQLDS
ncbi:MAG TPA: hypothetical protein VH369_10690 [Bryobacteraceae bacterium]|jgi:hypothetical protein